MEILQILPFRKKWKMQNKNPWNSSFHAQFIFYTTHPNITSWIQHAPRLFWHGKQENDQSILGSSLKVAPPPPPNLDTSLCGFFPSDHLKRGAWLLDGFPRKLSCQETTAHSFQLKIVGNFVRNGSIDKFIQESVSPFLFWFLVSLCVFLRVKC